ncbi:MAG: chromosome segregation protein SMC [Phycisphaerales bacterium]|nr:chromosome segregation protein SMC [Phycisphaerales bacterium]
MILKRVAMSGFKSFADRVEFEFAPGVTCIVGPNGCGKSNVVDAFKWVLGEQSARSLRGRQMLDMIFNGSSARKSAGMAQVDLIFGNEDRTLPIDRDEVSITRKLFRSGESEYMVCGEPSRLKDIREMFMDTGVGTTAYAVIEQGKVEGLLHSSPTERRVIFEEAAGISKYRARKKEAERKLGRTEQNLLRLADIVEEVEKRLRSVKLQAGKARNFQEYDQRLRELRASFAMAEYHRFSQALVSVQKLVDEANDEGSRLRTTIDQNEAKAAEFLGQSDALSEEIAACDNRLVNVRSEVSANEERVEAANKRIEEQQAALQRAQQRLTADEERSREQHAELDEVQEHAHALQEETHAQNSVIDELTGKEQTLNRNLTQSQAVLEDEKAGIFDLLRRTSQLHNEITSLAQHSENLSDQKGRLSERDAAISTELEQIITRRSALDGKLREVEDLIERDTQRLEEKKEAARIVDAERAEYTEQLAEAKEARSALMSRRQVLQDLQKRMDGVGAGVRQILDRKLLTEGEAAMEAVYGLVADAFETDVPRAHIVEAAIGDHDQHLVVRESAAFLADPGLLANLPERTTILCLDRLPQSEPCADFSDQPGFVAPAQSFVRYTETLEPLARALLGKTIVVDTLANALAMSAVDPGGHRFVTLDGEVVEPDGRVRIGPPHSSAGLISRRTELRSIDVQLSELGARIDELADALNRSSAQNLHLEQVQQELRTAIYELHTARVETRAALQSIEESIRRLTSEQPLIAGEVASIEQELAEAAARSSQTQTSLVELEQSSKEREAHVASLQEEIAALVIERDAIAVKLTEARVAAGQLMEKRAAAAETINALRRSIRTAEEAVEAAQHEIEDCKARIEESTAAIATSRERLAELQETLTQVENEGRELRRRREELRSAMEELASATRELRRNLGEAEQRLHEQQMALQEAKIHRDELIARVRDELELDLAQMYESYEHADQDWQAVEDEIAELRQKIQRLGNINLDAITELEELEEREAFLSGQRNDLEDARKQLDTLITQLNTECEKRFSEAFYAIRDNFRELFRKLFGGGKADIILENPDDPLETGIEILARPPGKELQSITLMSGGEKSMTAIALLMSIFRSRPSPFAILDEVDAALDEANNERFNGIIQEFLDRSQFIVITHSKRTMSIGDQMYGVTMQEPGVSTRVSVKFETKENEASAVA